MTKKKAAKDVPILHIDMDRKCKYCDKAGAMPSGVCLKCAADKISKTKLSGRHYEQSEEIESIATRLIAENHPFLAHAQIAYLLRTLDPDKKIKIPVKRPGKKAKMAKAIAVAEMYHSLCGYDFVLAVDELYWGFMSQIVKEALVDHELCHFARDESGYYVRDHDISEFTAVLERHGFWNIDLADFVAAAPEQKELPLKNVEGEKPETRVQ